MAKLIAPLFSFQAHGSLGRRITYQSRPKLHVARSTPHYPPTYSYAQVRQRWLYRMGIALWNGMDASDKAAYAVLASGTNTTAMNLWLREWLTTLPDVIYALPVAHGFGPLLYDLGPNDWNAAIIVPSWSGTPQHPAILADGIDDYVDLSSVAPFHLNYPA